MLTAPPDHLSGGFEQAACPLIVAAIQRMIDGRRDQPVLFQPLTGTEMQCILQIGIEGTQPLAERIRKQMVIAVPATAVVQGENKQVAQFQALETFLPIVPPGQCVAQRRGEPVQDRSLEQEALDLFGLVAQDFFHQVVQNVAVASGERLDEPVRIRRVLAAQGCRGHLQAGDPTFRARSQTIDGVCRQPQLHDLVEELGDLFVSEGQIGRAQLVELSLPAQPRERQRRYRARGNHEMDVVRQVIDQERHRPVDGW